MHHRPLLRRYLALAFAAAGLTAPHARAIEGKPAESFAYALVASGIAAHHCSGMLRDGERLAALRDAAHLADSDRPFLVQAMQKIDLKIRQDIAEQGLQRWCAEAWMRLGPAPGLGVLRKSSSHGD